MPANDATLGQVERPWWDSLGLKPEQVALVDRIWAERRATGHWPLRKPILLELERNGIERNTLLQSHAVFATEGRQDDPSRLRPSMAALLYLPSVRDLLRPLPEVVREACRRFVEAPNYPDVPRTTKLRLSEMVTH